MKAQEKKELRKRMLALRRALTPEEVNERSARVIKRLVESDLLSGRGLAALYAAADGEVRTRPIHERLSEQGSLAVLPRVRGAGPEIDFFPVTDWDRLVVSALGIPEPETDGKPVDPAEFDLVVVPGVAFDPRGGRLGYGMGCYDRVLSRTRTDALLLGLAYDFQMVEQIPIERHDAPLTAIVTESAIIQPRPGE